MVPNDFGDRHDPYERSIELLVWIARTSNHSARTGAGSDMARVYEAMITECFLDDQRTPLNRDRLIETRSFLRLELQDIGPWESLINDLRGLVVW